jgi:membrane protease YdiL (CAAX protease family)
MRASMVRRCFEILAIVVLYLALREFVGATSGQLWRVVPELEGIAFYLLWVGVLGAAAWLLRWKPCVWPVRAAWTRGNVIVFVVATIITTELFYGFRIARLAIGEISFHAPEHGTWLVNGVVFAPLVEEWLFRGVLWRLISERLDGAAAVVVPLVVTSLLFGVWHWMSIFQPSWYGAPRTPLWVHMAFAAMLGILRWRLRAIGPGIVLHALGNGLAELTG